MPFTARRTWWVAPVALLFGAAFAAPALAVPETHGAAAVADDQIPPNHGPSTCTGGAQKASIARINDTPVTIGETGAFVPLTSASVGVTVPPNDNDQFVVRFTGEAVLAGQPVPVTVPADEIQLQLVVVAGGVATPLAPLNDPTFTTGVGGAHALQACTRLGPGNYTIAARWRAVDVAANNVLAATMDDWLLSVEQND